MRNSSLLKTVEAFRALLSRALPNADLGRINSRIGVIGIRINNSFKISELIDLTADWSSSSIEGEFNHWHSATEHYNAVISIDKTCYGEKALAELFNQLSPDELQNLFENEYVVNEITNLIKGYTYCIPDESYVLEDITKQDKIELTKFLNQL